MHFDSSDANRVVVLSNWDSSSEKANYKKSQWKPYIISFDEKPSNTDEICHEKDDKVL